MEQYQFISGKLFDIKTNKEIDIHDFKRAIMLNSIKNQGYITRSGIIVPLLAKDVEEIMDNLSLMDTLGEWPELPLVTKAKELGPVPLNTKLTFPLTKKQLIIINRLLFHPEDEVLFITTGTGGTGKSTFLNLIKQLFDNDFSATSVGDLTNDFSTAEAVKHRLICSDELGKGDLDTKILKTLASKQYIFVNPKHKTGYTVKSQSALFWCCNNVPRIDCTDDGIMRRIVFYCRNKVIENPDPKLNKQKFTEEQLLTILRYSLNFEYEGNEWKKPFEKETHLILKKDNSVYICKNAITYEDYKTMSIQKGLRPFNEQNWAKIKDLFDEWELKDYEQCEGN